MRAGAVVAVIAALACTAWSASPQSRRAPHGVRVVTIHYLAGGSYRRTATVLLPSWYGPHRNPPIPLIISPHGRGVSGRANAANWGSLPTVGGFAVVNPDGRGRRLPLYSWGYRRQVDDLARMPHIVERTIPWVRIDERRIYAFGSSMGGQETLLLVARHPELLAGAAAFDSVTDFALQYRNFGRLPCNRKCRRMFTAPLGAVMRGLARYEVGGSPGRAVRRYASRSPLTYAPEIARACVPLQLWWSKKDRIVTEQRRQSARLLKRLRQLGPRSPVLGIVGTWRHSYEMQASTHLARALTLFGLLPKQAQRRLQGVHVVELPARRCMRRPGTTRLPGAPAAPDPL